MARIFTHAHGEAFALMKYQDRETGAIEWLWNSRDGVCPFAVGTPGEGKALMRHVDWAEDVCAPNFVPPVGMRVFVSFGDAPETALEDIRNRWGRHIEKLSAAGYQEPPGIRDEVPFGMTPEQPVVVTVDEALHRHFADLARENPVVAPRRRS